MKLSKLLLKIIMLVTLFGVPSVLFASDKLPIELRINESTGVLSIKNSGSCHIYKLEIRTVPPETEGFLNFISMAGAELAGIGSFSKNLGTLEIGLTSKIDKSSMLNNDGKKLSGKYKVGSWHFVGNYCGESKSVSFEGDD